MKQSAVEWQFYELERVNFEYATSKITPRDFQEQREKIFRQSNEMFKQQIMDARQDGYECTYAEYGETPKCYLDGSNEQYYNETFNK